MRQKMPTGVSQKVPSPIEGEGSLFRCRLCSPHNSPKPRSQLALRQRGQALLLALLVLGAAGGAVLFSYYRPATLTLESEQKTTDALALVKTALIGWTVKRGNGCSQTTAGTPPATWTTCTGDDRPGEFPCPDTNNDGVAESNCSVGELGRVPWKTLAIPEPKDSAGETLWYAVADRFRTRATNNDKPLNSDTLGTITVYAADGTTLLADASTYQTPKGAAAVIFAPGRAIGTQIRDAAIAYCATTDTNIARNLCAANYLETSGSTPRDNAKTDGPFINGKLSATFNDRLVYITTPEFMPSVEKRVLSDLGRWMDGYRATASCQCYPWPANFNLTDPVASRTSPSWTNASNTSGVNRGRVPYNQARPSNWASGSIPRLSTWFYYNNWHNVIYYTVAKQNLEAAGVSCSTCGGLSLSLDLNPIVSTIMFSPGTPLGSISRASNVLADYLEDPTNKDGDDAYITPTATVPDRDRVYTSTSGAVPTNLMCGPAGKALRKLATCGQPPKLNPQCAALAGTDPSGVPLLPLQGLQLCSVCAVAAWTLVNPPCQNSLKPSACKSAYSILNNC